MDVLVKISVVALSFYCSVALSADIFFMRGSPERMEGHSGKVPDGWMPRIIIDGPIYSGDESLFVDALNKAKRDNSKHGWNSYKQLLLNSDGGDVETAMTIGRMVRKEQIITGVHEGNTCASACTLILAGGVRRYARDFSRIGLHRPYFTDPKQATAQGYKAFQNAYDAVINAHARYFSEMKIGVGLLDKMVQIPSNHIHWISVDEATRLNLLGEDAAYAEWRMAKRIATEGAACVDWSDNRYWPCLAKFGFDAGEHCAKVTNKPPQCK